MKYFLFILLIIAPLDIICQVTCKPTIIHFNRQSQVDSFPIIFKGCEYIDTVIHITQAGIQQLDSLYFVKRFRNLRVVNTEVEDLDGLHGLDSVGSIEIHGNKFLKNLQGLKNLTKAGTISIGDNDSLITLHGLNVDSVFTGLSITDSHINQKNGLLKNLEGLNVVFLKSLWLSNNLNMEDLGGTNNIQLDRLVVRYNNTLKKISELNPRELIDISFSSAITDISELNELIKIPNHDLKTLKLSYLPNLQNCTIEYICQNIDKEGFLFVEKNGQGCNSISEIRAACLSSTSTVPEQKWKVTPNPFWDEFTIEWPEDISFGNICKIINAQGKEVVNFYISNQMHNITIAAIDWPAGVYFYTVQSPAGVQLICGKLVKL